MRHSLSEQLARANGPAPRVRREEQARLVQDFARILRETAAAAAATRPGGPSDEPGNRHSDIELPQILLPKPIQVRETRRPIADWLASLPGLLARQVASAPVTTAFAVAAAAVITLGWQGQLKMPEPGSLPWGRLASAVEARPAGARSPVAVQSVRTVSVEPARDGAAIVVEAERLIGAGNVEGARELLGHAAVRGDREARFALAETFDPNVLAAWGARGTAADPGTARLLYEQALAGGDQRAVNRIKALSSD